jgi:hypothetical protein
MNVGQRLKIKSGPYKGRFVTLVRPGTSGWFVKETDIEYVFRNELDLKLYDLQPHDPCSTETPQQP